MGKGIQEAAVDVGLGDLLPSTSSEHPEHFVDGFKKVNVDHLHKNGAYPMKDYRIAILVAGRGNQGTAIRE